MYKLGLCQTVPRLLFFITMLLEKYNVLIDLMFFQIIKVLFEYFSIFSGKLNKVLH